MSIFKRLSLIFRAKANKQLDRLEDPRETLDYSYTKMTDLLAKTRRGVADVATSRKRVELQLTQIDAQADRLTQQAGQAIKQDREDLAREALTRKAALSEQRTALVTQLASLQEQEEKLVAAQRRLTSQVEAFRVRKETTKATYTAAVAQTQINESLSGLSSEMGSVGEAIARAEDKTAQMQARAGAIDELMASGAFDLPGSGDDIDRELNALSASADVEAELARLKSNALPVSQPILREIEE